MKLKEILVVSAHADDETFGMGGTLSRLSTEGNCRIHWLIMTKIWSPKWNESALTSRDSAINKLTKIIGFNSITQWDYKDNLLDTYPVNDIQESMIVLLNRIKPETIYVPSPWDFNFEHRLTCDIVEMSSKPYYSPYVKEIIAYEIPSATESSFNAVRNFPANYYIDIKDNIQLKENLMNLCDTEFHKFPHPRSLDYVKSLARVRGGESGLEYAEAFNILKMVLK